MVIQRIPLGPGTRCYIVSLRHDGQETELDRGIFLPTILKRAHVDARRYDAGAVVLKTLFDERRVLIDPLGPVRFSDGGTIKASWKHRLPLLFFVPIIGVVTYLARKALIGSPSWVAWLLAVSGALIPLAIALTLMRKRAGSSTPGPDTVMPASPMVLTSETLRLGTMTFRRDDVLGAHAYDREKLLVIETAADVRVFACPAADQFYRLLA